MKPATDKVSPSGEEVLDSLLSAVAHLQKIIPGAVMVGGSAAAFMPETGLTLM